jgi:hypothetical protein
MCCTITREEIFDLRSDSAEMHPVAQGAQLTPAFRRLLGETLAEARHQGAAPAAVPIDDQTQEQLRALGYLPASPPSPPANRAAVPTP